VNARVYNLLDAEVSDIDYYFASRLPGEPLGGVDDIHVHPAVPRTLRVSMVFGFRERLLTPTFQFSNFQEIKLFWELGVGCWAFDAPQEGSPAAGAVTTDPPNHAGRQRRRSSPIAKRHGIRNNT
jgi:hypothetical protein